jgi:hypothetical protein
MRGAKQIVLGRNRRWPGMDSFDYQKSKACMKGMKKGTTDKLQLKKVPSFTL